MRIIPAIDIIDGKCVRLSMGDYESKKVYSNDPAEMAKGFEAIGVKYLHLVDLDGARNKEVTNWEVVQNVCSSTNLTIDFGGGVRTSEEVDRLLDIGVAQINVGSLAVREPELFISWIKKHGPEKFILSVDLKDGKVATHGWMNTSEMSGEEFINSFSDHVFIYVVSTDISRDGMLNGPNFELYTALVNAFPDIRIIASGGVATEKDILDLVPTGVDGVITGKAIYEGKIDLKRVIDNAN